MENPATGFCVAIDEPETDPETLLPAWPDSMLKPPKKTCGTDWLAVTSIALQPGWLIGGAMTGWQELPVKPSAVNFFVELLKYPGTTVRCALDPLSART